MTKRSIAYLSLTTTSLIWSVGAILIKYSLNFTSPYTFLFWRFLIVAWIFLPFVIIQVKKESLTVKELPKIFILGFMATTLTLVLLFWGTKLTSAVEAVIINSLSPIFIIIGGGLFLKEKISRKIKIGAGLAVLGSILTVLQPILDNGLTGTNFKGNLLVFISALFWAAYSLIIRKDESRHRYSALTLTGISFIAGLITITPLFLTQSDLSLAPQALPAILYMAIFGSCIAYFTYNLGFSLIKACEASIFTHLQLVFSVPLAIIFLHEKIDQWIILGVIIILVGVFLTEYKRRINT